MIPVNHCSDRVSGPLVALEEVATPRYYMQTWTAYPSGELATWMSLMYAPKTTPACSGLFHIYQVRILRCKPTRSTSRIQHARVTTFCWENPTNQAPVSLKNKKNTGITRGNPQSSGVLLAYLEGPWPMDLPSQKQTQYSVALAQTTGAVSVGLQDRTRQYTTVF